MHKIIAGGNIYGRSIFSGGIIGVSNSLCNISTCKFNGVVVGARCVSGLIG